MTFANLTQADAIRIRDVLAQLADTEKTTKLAIEQGKIQTALDWWDTVKPDIPTTRDEAITVYNFILSLLDTETESYRLAVLRNKLIEANEKFKEIKAFG